MTSPGPHCQVRRNGAIAGKAVGEKTYLVVAGAVAAAIAADLYANDSEVSLFLVKRLFQLVEYLEFWR